jgi:hypothetical protein
LIYLSFFYLAHNTIVNDVFKRPLLVPACRARLFRSVGQRTWLSDSDKSFGAAPLRRFHRRFAERGCCVVAR